MTGYPTNDDRFLSNNHLFPFQSCLFGKRTGDDCSCQSIGGSQVKKINAMQTSFQQNLHPQNNLAYERAAAEKARDKYEVLVDELGQVWCKNCDHFRTNLLMDNNRSCLFSTEPDDNSLPTIFLDSLDSRKPSTPRFHISLTPIFILLQVSYIFGDMSEYVLIKLKHD